VNKEGCAAGDKHCDSVTELENESVCVEMCTRNGYMVLGVRASDRKTALRCQRNGL
jgi:hypothetical protein